MSQRIDDYLGGLYTSNFRVSMALKMNPIPDNRDVLVRVDAKLNKDNRQQDWDYPGNLSWYQALRGVGR